MIGFYLNRFLSSATTDADAAEVTLRQQSRAAACRPHAATWQPNRYTQVDTRLANPDLEGNVVTLPGDRRQSLTLPPRRASLTPEMLAGARFPSDLEQKTTD